MTHLAYPCFSLEDLNQIHSAVDTEWSHQQTVRKPRNFPHPSISEDLSLEYLNTRCVENRPAGVCHQQQMSSKPQHYPHPGFLNLHSAPVNSEEPTSFHTNVRVVEVPEHSTEMVDSKPQKKCEKSKAPAKTRFQPFSRCNNNRRPPPPEPRTRSNTAATRLGDSSILREEGPDEIPETVEYMNTSSPFEKMKESMSSMTVVAQIHHNLANHQSQSQDFGSKECNFPDPPGLQGAQGADSIPAKGMAIESTRLPEPVGEGERDPRLYENMDEL
jgi:hypothetical protein